MELALVILLEEDGADQAGDQALVGEDADDVGTPLDLLVVRSSELVECSLIRCCWGKVNTDDMYDIIARDFAEAVLRNWDIGRYR